VTIPLAAMLLGSLGLLGGQFLGPNKEATCRQAGGKWIAFAGGAAKCVNGDGEVDLTSQQIASPGGQSDVSAAREPEPDDQAVLGYYLQLPSSKAFAWTYDESTGLVAAGVASELPTPEEAMREALLQCAVSAERQGISTGCELLAVGNTLLQQPARPRAASTPATATRESTQTAPVQTTGSAGARLPEIEYSAQWINGQRFAAATSGRVQVWAAIERDPLQAVVMVGNATDQPLLVSPHHFVLEALDGGAAVRLATFSDHDWERKIRRRQAIALGLAAFSASGQALRQQPRTYSYQGSGTGIGNYSGTITAWPNYADRIAAQAAANAQMSAMASQFSNTFAAMASTLFRQHTLSPGSTYGGVIHFEKHKASRYRLSVRLDGRDELKAMCEALELTSGRRPTSCAGRSTRRTTRTSSSACCS
jgi:hypothetical protein